MAKIVFFNPDCGKGSYFFLFITKKYAKKFFKMIRSKIKKKLCYKKREKLTIQISF